MIYCVFQYCQNIEILSPALCDFDAYPCKKSIEKSNKQHRIVKEAVYGKLVKQIRTVRVYSNPYCEVFLVFETTYMVNLAFNPPPPLLKQKIICYAYSF